MAVQPKIILTLLVLASAARADLLIIPGAQPQPVTFVGFEGDKLLYQTRSGDRNDREVARISHINVDGETALNEAEDAFSRDQTEKAIEAYIRTIRATAKPWIKTYAAKRLLAALGDGNRFDARLLAYLSILTTNPDDAPNYRPKLPDRGSKLLDVAVADVETAIRQPGLGAPQTLALYTFLIELQRHRGDDTAVMQALERLDKLSSSLGDMPEVKQQLARAKVSRAQVAFDQKKYAEVVKLIEDNRQNIVEPRVQSDAVFLLARATHALTDPKNKSAMLDVAVMYMRVVAHFGDLEGKPNVLESLLATAGILEQAGDKDGAARLLQQAINEFPEVPDIRKAKQDLDRLKSAS